MQYLTGEKPIVHWRDETRFERIVLAPTSDALFVQQRAALCAAIDNECGVEFTRDDTTHCIRYREVIACFREFPND